MAFDLWTGNNNNNNNDNNSNNNNTTILKTPLLLQRLKYDELHFFIVFIKKKFKLLIRLKRL